MSVDTITAKEASDALLKLCKAKDGLHPYITYIFEDCPQADAVAAGIETAMDVMATQYEIINDFIDQQEKAEKEVQS